MIPVLLLGLYLVIIGLMMLQSLMNIRFRLFLWEDPARAGLNAVPNDYAEPTMSFTVLVPARHEEAVIGATLDKICQAHYPKDLIQILVICEQSDIGTIAKVQAKLSEPGKEHVQLITFSDTPINKPHGLNKGLSAATGEVVTVFDAEDEPHADIFHIVNTTMVNESVEVVQGGVHLMNYDTSWFSALNVLEYFFWFKSSLHYFAWSSIVPLGGNTVFMKRWVLEALGGWDEGCLTEDADIGIRLSAAEMRIRVLCDDEHVTREETPPTVAALVKQRTRWCQGFLQVLLKGDWKHLQSRSQRLLAAYILSAPLIQALFVLMLPVSLLMMIFVKLPVELALITFMPLYAFGLQACIDLAGLLEFLHAQKGRFSWRVVFFMVLGFYPYQILLALAALRAVIRHLRHNTTWEKTVHTGVHRQIRSAA